MRLLPCLTVLALCSPVFSASAPVASVAETSLPLPAFGTLRSGIQFAGESVDGDFSLLVPLHSTLGKGGVVGGTLIFAEPYAQWAERGAAQAGLGIGFRHLFSGQSVSDMATDHSGFADEGFYVGANAFIDMADTNRGRWWQLGLAAEIGSRYLELRGRYHLPLDDGENTRVHRVTSYDQSFDENVGPARLVGETHLVVDSVFNFLTESLRGWEVEAVGIIPGIDHWVDLRVVGGYASFQSPTFDSINYDTWKLGVEFRPVPAVVLSATHFSNPAIVGDDWLFGVGVEIPIGTGDGLWTSIKNAFKPRRRHLSERLIEPTRRGALPMQLATGLKSAKTTVTFDQHVALILPDGTVVVVAERSGTASATSSNTSSGTVIFSSGTSLQAASSATVGLNNSPTSSMTANTSASGSLTTATMQTQTTTSSSNASLTTTFLGSTSGTTATLNIGGTGSTQP